RERYGGVVKSDRHVNTGGFEPATRDGNSDISLVLMVGENDLDGLAQHRASNIIDGHSRRYDRALAAQIRVKSRLVVKHANPDNIAGNLRVRTRRFKTRHSKDRTKDNSQSHTVP